MADALAILTTTILGLFAGSLLTEAMLLVPYFRSLRFEEFNRSHRDFGPRLYRYYAPLTVLATLLPILSAAYRTFIDPQDSRFAWLAAALGLGILATYVLYFRRANLAFAQQRLDEAALQRELGRWAGVHNFRTILAIGAFIASILATLRWP